MANLDAAMGFRALQSEAGTAPKVQAFTIEASTTVFEGTQVAVNTTGKIIAYTQSSTVLAQRCIGVAAHFRQAADASATVLVYTDPAQLYEVQSDDNTLTVIGDVVGRNFQVLNVAAGSGTTLQSTAEIDGSSGTSLSLVTGTSTARRPWQALGFSRNIQNDNATTNNTIIVRLNPGYHLFAGTGGT